ncbi:amidase [Roseibium aestuarii]|uniref:Amidase n=1 Tax=Roseibium aestuarii TaxID=2600299 RepID=A0ABW4JU25_9HYPH|nr:amidase [Roseibium aestuarii]
MTLSGDVMERSPSARALEETVLDQSAGAVLAQFAAGDISPVDYMEALIARVEAREPKVCALWDFRPEAALEQARASEARWHAGTPCGPLDGMPVTLKELIATKGDPVPNGTAASDMTPASDDAPAAARLREDGAIFFAKTTCPDFGMLSSGLSTFHHLSRNPWDLLANPGGSSAGSGSAGAAGYGPLHVGTDIGGSVRLPAGWTGLFGFKASQGRVPAFPYYPGRCIGPMTRTVEDGILLMKSLSRPDWRDATSLPPMTESWDVAPMDLRGKRIGYMAEAGCGLGVDRDVAEAVAGAVRWFEAQGAEIVPLDGVLTRTMLDGLDDFWRARFWAQMETFSEERRAKVLPYILDWASAASSLSGARVAAGFDQMLAIRQATARIFTQVDLLLSPVNPIVSFPAEWPSPTNDPAKPFEHIAFTMPFNMGDQPACSINCGFSESGMPIGLQIVAPRFGDLDVLSAALAYEQARGPITNWPEL